MASPRERVLLAARRYLETAQTYEPHYGLIFGKLDDSYQPSDAARLVGLRGFERLTELVAGMLPSDASAAQQRTQALQIWALIHGFVGLKSHAVGELVDMRCWKERTLDAVEMLIDAILARQQAGRPAAGR
ncbi:TetR-like C-terminal domain-containing protein [Halopseudomonas maritima]|uniref:TetR-like C-terminal domain-containing protein n=1 Tax=Halopseudomonas maritima TaxID=2918528 RepID=UPI001EEBCABF|nr:TetR-like C-terminal domain-containing protein [Halopseudomonas maritima]UJJ32272.1 WHG domain-containing protein [Halopseudomonas maritima]